MKLTNRTVLRRALVGGIGAAALLSTNLPSHAAPLTAAETTELGTEAYIYGYPLVTMEYTRRVMTNVAKVEGSRAPMGQLGAMRKYPDPTFLDVTAPNADTLYSFGFFDVSKEPFVLSLPEAKDRYYLFPMLSGWTDVFQDPGKRTTGTGPQKYVVTGPGWAGTLPEGVKEYKSPTGIVWILGRIYCTATPEDYAAVHKMQDEISVVPLSAYGKPYTPPAHEVDPSIDMKTAVREQVNALNAETYFSLLAKLMKDNPPASADAPMVAKLTKLGITPGEAFDAGKLGADGAKALAEVPKLGVEKIMGWFKGGIAAGDGKLENGWLFSIKTGLYGTNYIQRAFVTAIGLGANRPQDAIYPTSEADAEGKPYSGANKYVMHFDKGLLPPAQGFWSLTMYNGGYFFVANPLNRYSISARQDLKANADGSVDLYLQNESPGADKESNWLPAPKDKFILMLRLYWPSEKNPSIIDGTWKVPAVKVVE
ncbi:MAG: DUF1254 domain-containing protein [Luteolibacter sp.]|uniref:DUF1254 domain-containing protein n=1 Tax=Luteolibacter sp. TaxID=1962973 RepID=UPI0032654F47